MHEKSARKRTICTSNDAQSSVLGFVLVLSIVLSATTMFFGTQIPQWTEQYEFEHASKVHQDFADLGSIIDLALVREDPSASASLGIGMRPESILLAGVLAAGGTLRFQPAGETFTCLACAPTAPYSPGSGAWESKPQDMDTYDTFHVDVLPGVGAELEFETGYNQLFDSGGNETLTGEFWYNNFTVTNSTTLTTHWLAIHAVNITIGPNSSIVADGGGLFGGKYNADGQGEGYGYAAASDHYSVGGGGAGFGGAGGAGGGANPDNSFKSGGQNGSTFGDEYDIALDAGSGGGGGNRGRLTEFGYYVGGNGGEGGGVIFLDAPIITIYGNVSANGGDGKVGSHNAVDSAGGGGGGGSGGTILLKGGAVTLHGMLSAHGGDGFDGSTACNNDNGMWNNNGGGGGGGGGGRIKIYNRTALITLEPDWHDHTDVRGGAGGLGGVGWRDADPDCPGGNPMPPSPGYNGLPGYNGTAISTYLYYSESVPHHPSGHITSSRFDAGSEMVCYGTMTWDETTPSGTNIALKVRTAAMDASMTDALPWEECPEVTKGQDISSLSSVSDGHRYVQWRAELLTIDRMRSPILHTVTLSYESGVPMLTSASGCISFESQYLYLPNFELSYASGATIRHQAAGTDFITFPPPIVVSKDTNNRSSLMVSTINLTGDGAVISGAFSSAVKAAYQDHALLCDGLSFRTITFAINTAYPRAWTDWFNETCAAAGLAYGTGAGDYSFSESGGTLYVEFHGDETTPVKLWLKSSEVNIELLD